jgi:hypothetical protein
MLKWSTDSNNRVIVNIAGKAYSHEDAIKLRDELNHVLRSSNEEKREI